ncbi:pyrroline-5-carboxylate reductase [Saxibacter everestensis]|uniref:Pyrroline-5-carboxylate reductase n=1 Tax=Saxibacter everestensis TaxID=2909229 RepID=A0ABY8QRV4_9MICO|nr:pyrroline-5-carboxylate reductase [Brevibacteriaceae bacterium ZFBP1038]
MTDPTVAVLGVGSMGEALLSGILRAGLPAGSVTATVRSPDRASELRQRTGVTVLDTSADAAANQSAAREADIVILAVKPHGILDLASEISDAVTRDCVVISVAAGITTSAIETRLPGAAVVRAMPNTPSLVGAGVVAIAAGESADQDALDRAAAILAGAGMTRQVREDQLDAVTAISGSGPAYFFLLAEALVDAGQQLGLDPETAKALVVGTAAGAGALMEQTGKDPAQLREQVTSPGGTTKAALDVFEEHGLREIALAAAQAAARRSAELSS